jgi:hypothetical protein
MSFVTPQVDIDRCLAVESTVTAEELPLYLDCLGDVPMSVRVKTPRVLDRPGRDVRDGCILTGVFERCRKAKQEKRRTRW